MEDAAFANDNAPHTSSFDIFKGNYPFKEAKLQLPGVPPWWVKTDAGTGILFGDGISHRHTHAYIHEPSSASFGFGAHLKDEATGEHLYSSKPRRWFLKEDLARWCSRLGQTFSGLLCRVLPNLPEGVAFRSLDQLLHSDPWGRRPTWHPIHISEMIRSFERKPGVIVVDEVGIQRMVGAMPLQESPELLTRKKKGQDDGHTLDIAFRIPLKKDFLAFLLREFLKGHRQSVLLDPNDPVEVEVTKELYWAASWALKALDDARNGPLYVVIRSGIAEHWLREMLDWALTAAIETFQSRDMKDYWTGLREKVRQARQLNEIDWEQVFNVDLPRLFGRTSSPATNPGEGAAG